MEDASTEALSNASNLKTFQQIFAETVKSDPFIAVTQDGQFFIVTRSDAFKTLINLIHGMEWKTFAELFQEHVFLTQEELVFHKIMTYALQKMELEAVDEDPFHKIVVANLVNIFFKAIKNEKLDFTIANLKNIASQYLLRYKIDQYETKITTDNKTFLEEAIESGYFISAKYLIEIYYRTADHYDSLTAHDGKPSIFSLILSGKKGDVKKRNEFLMFFASSLKDTEISLFLKFACNRNECDTLQWLLEYCKKIDALKDKFDSTSVYKVVMEQWTPSLEILRFFQQQEVNIHQQSIIDCWKEREKEFTSVADRRLYYAIKDCLSNPDKPKLASTSTATPPSSPTKAATQVGQFKQSPPNLQEPSIFSAYASSSQLF